MCVEHRLRACPSEGVGHHKDSVRQRGGKASQGREETLSYALVKAVVWRSWRRAKEKWDVLCHWAGCSCDLPLLVLNWKWEQKLEKLSVINLEPIVTRLMA